MKKRYLLLIYASLIAFLSLRSSSELQDWGDIPNLDKLQHFMAYSCFSLLAAVSVRHWWQRGVAAFAILLFSGGIELAQAYVGRESSWFDLLANLSGIILGLLTYKLYCVYRSRNVKSIYSND
ncbi:VanZ family protein [Vibrio vulnificus]|nr:VanZ family protein [Vibrio vulnificus]